MYIEGYIHRLTVRCLLENIVILFSVVWLLACIFFTSSRWSTNIMNSCCRKAVPKAYQHAMCLAIGQREYHAHTLHCPISCGIIYANVGRILAIQPWSILCCLYKEILYVGALATSYDIVLGEHCSWIPQCHKLDFIHDYELHTANCIA